MKPGRRVVVQDPFSGGLMTGTVIRIRPPEWYHKCRRTVEVRIDPDCRPDRRIGWWAPGEVGRLRKEAR